MLFKIHKLGPIIKLFGCGGYVLFGGIRRCTRLFGTRVYLDV